MWLHFFTNGVVCLYAMDRWMAILDVHVPKHPLQFQIDEMAFAISNYFVMLETVVATCSAAVQQDMTVMLEASSTRVKFFSAWAGMHSSPTTACNTRLNFLVAWQKATEEKDSKAKQQPSNMEAKVDLWKNHIEQIYTYMCYATFLVTNFS